jgi:chemotaxis protein MotB
MSARRHRAHAHEEEHENHERWLITYADMITLLMVLFIVLYAIGQTDLAKFEALKKGLSSSLGTGKASIVAEGGDGVLSGAAKPIAAIAQAALRREQEQQQAVQQEKTRLTGAEETITRELSAAGLQNAVTFRMEERGLIVTIVSDSVLFDVGSADLRDDGRSVLDHLASALAQLPNHLAIEGHTDNTPIVGGGRYASNWELSTARSTAVLRYLVEAHGLSSDRVSAAGYADQRPVAPNDNPADKARNRRVEIVVLSETAQNAKEG